MEHRSRLWLAGTLLLAGLGLVGVTTAWFVSLSQTPAGVVNSALVRYLPGRGEERDADSLLTYGSLISGNSVDTQGVPLIIPGDLLLSTQVGEGDGRRVRSSLARPVQSGETPGTVIYGETRRDTGGGEVSMTWRELMNAYETRRWYQSGDGSGDPVSDPELNPARYTAVTTATTAVVGGTNPEGLAVTTTTVTLKTVYTPLDPEGLPYTFIQETVEEVTRERAVYTPSEAAFHAVTGEALALTRKREETVLFVDPAQDKTRSYLILTETPAQVPGGAEVNPIPLRVGNLSTTATNLRLGITATVTHPGAGGGTTTTALTLREGTGRAEEGRLGYCYLGQMEEGKFVELFRLKLAGGADYAWTYNTAESSTDGAWKLFDLTLTAPAEGGKATDVPPVAQTQGEETKPVDYAVLEELRVVAESDFIANTPAAKTAFEERFNKLYCSDAPMIELSLHYYAKQSAYMEWTEFYSDSLRFSVNP